MKAVCWFVIVGSFVAIDRPHSHTLFKSKSNWLLWLLIRAAGVRGVGQGGGGAFKDSSYLLIYQRRSYWC